MENFRLKTSDLRNAVKSLSITRQPKSVLPILDYIRCDATNGKVDLTLTNLETTVIYSLVTMDGPDEGCFLIEYDELKKILSVISTDTITISIDNNQKVLITSGYDQFDLGKSEKVEDYPRIPSMENKQAYDLSSDVLKTMAIATKTCASQVEPDENDAFKFVCLDRQPEFYAVVSTDKVGLYSKKFYNYRCPIKDAGRFLVPPKIAQEIGSWPAMKLQYNESHLAFVGIESQIIVTRSESKFPDYEKVFPSTSVSNFRTEKHVLKDALEKCLIIDSNQVMIDSQNMMLESHDHMTGKWVKSKISVGSIEGDEFEVLLKGDRMKSLLDQLEGNELRIDVIDSVKAVTITSPNEESARLLIMPIAQTK